MPVVINGTTGITNVNGSAAAPAETGTDTDTGIYYGTNTVGLATNGTNALFVDASQNVGIGTSSPGSALSVRTSELPGGVAGRGTMVIGPRPEDSAAANIFFLPTSSTAGISIGAPAAEPSVMTFNRWGSGSSYLGESMRIDSSGNLLVGRTSRLNNGKIEALASTSEQAFVAQVQTNANSLFQGFNAAGSVTFYVVGTGGIFSTSTTITAISDVSQKENIRAIEYGIAEVCALKPVKFDFKKGCASEEKDLLGFIAQEVEPVLPELVKPFGDGGLKGLKTGDMIPVLVKAIQELKAQNDDLRARVAALEGAK